MKNIKYIHPFLFSLFPALYLFSINLQELYNIALQFLPMILVLSLLFCGVVFGITYVVTGRDICKTSVLTTFLLFVFSSYGYFFDFLHSTFESDLIRHRYILPLLVVFTLGAVGYTFFSKKPLEKVNNFLQVTVTILLIFTLATILKFIVSGQEIDSLTATYQIPESDIPPSSELTYTPDIYYIILDGYADSDVLRVFYNYDNSEFLDFLEDKGFFLAHDSVSNYGYTYASLASSLNMQYLDEAVDAVGVASDSVRSFSYIIENNAVVEMLKKLGYTYIHFGSGYPMTNFNRHADVSYREGLDRFSLFLLNSSILRPVTDPTSPWRIGFTKNDEVRKRILFELDTLQSLPNDTTIAHPRFTFTHIVSPHHPYVFDAKGNAVTERPEDSPEGYLDQVTFINSRMMEIVDSILENSAVPPVIIIQSDHGWNPSPGDSKSIKFHNFTAINLGQATTSGLSESVSPVNIFREVFNRVFGTSLPILEKEVYITTKESRLDFNNITDEVLEQQEEVLGE